MLVFAIAFAVFGITTARDNVAAALVLQQHSRFSCRGDASKPCPTFVKIGDRRFSMEWIFGSVVPEPMFNVTIELLVPDNTTLPQSDGGCQPFQRSLAGRVVFAAGRYEDSVLANCGRTTVMCVQLRVVRRRSDCLHLSENAIAANATAIILGNTLPANDNMGAVPNNPLTWRGIPVAYLYDYNSTATIAEELLAVSAVPGELVTLGDVGVGADAGGTVPAYEAELSGLVGPTDGLSVVDFASDAPLVITHDETRGAFGDVRHGAEIDVTRSLAWIADWPRALLAYDVSNPLAPQLEVSLDSRAIHALLAGGGDKKRRIDPYFGSDLHDGVTGMQTLRTPDDRDILFVTLHELAERNASLYVLDVSELTAPVALSAVSPAQSNGVHDGFFLHVAEPLVVDEAVYLFASVATGGATYISFYSKYVEIYRCNASDATLTPTHVHTLTLDATVESLHVRRSGARVFLWATTMDDWVSPRTDHVVGSVFVYDVTSPPTPTLVAKLARASFYAPTLSFLDPVDAVEGRTRAVLSGEQNGLVLLQFDASASDDANKLTSDVLFALPQFGACNVVAELCDIVYETGVVYTAAGTQLVVGGANGIAVLSLDRSATTAAALAASVQLVSFEHRAFANRYVSVLEYAPLDCSGTPNGDKTFDACGACLEPDDSARHDDVCPTTQPPVVVTSTAVTATSVVDLPASNNTLSVADTTLVADTTVEATQQPFATAELIDGSRVHVAASTLIVAAVAIFCP